MQLGLSRDAQMCMRLFVYNHIILYYLVVTLSENGSSHIKFDIILNRAGLVYSVNGPINQIILPIKLLDVSIKDSRVSLIA